MSNITKLLENQLTNISVQALSQTSSGQVDFHLSFTDLQQQNCHFILCFVEMSYANFWTYVVQTSQ